MILSIKYCKVYQKLFSQISNISIWETLPHILSIFTNHYNHYICYLSSSIFYLIFSRFKNHVCLFGKDVFINDRHSSDLGLGVKLVYDGVADPHPGRGIRPSK